jgi:phage-related baseplate assembly protein
MSEFTAIDLSQLPAPTVVEPLDFTTILNESLVYLQALNPDLFTGILPSDPAYLVLETMAYRELLLRNRINESAKQCMLAYAIGSNLDQLGAFYGVERFVLIPADPLAFPPVEAVLESDDNFRERIQLSLEGFSTAGSVGAYRFHALSADADVKDVGITQPTAGTVQVSVLSRTGSGTAGTPLLTAVENALNAESVRPFTDTVEVVSASILNYSVTAELTLFTGPDMAIVLETAQEALTAYVDAQHKVGATVSLSGLYAALHQAGVESVSLTAPTANVVASATQAPYCTAISVTEAV